MIYGISVESILTSTLIFVRISAILFALPFFGDEPIPARVRILLGVAMAFIIQGQIPVEFITKLPEEALGYILMVVKEVVIGLFLGFVGKLSFDAIIMAASLVGYQMGFGTADLMMPGADAQMSAFTAFHRTIMMMIFLSLNLHYIYLDGIVRTFQLIPAGGAMPRGELGVLMIQMTSGLFRVAMQLAAPVLVALIFSNTALGLVARTVPQLQVFTMSFPVGFFTGFIIYMACLPFFPNWTLQHFSMGQENLMNTIQALKP